MMSTVRVFISLLIAAFALTAPAAAQAPGDQLARGEQLYLTSCVSCHGVGGVGTADFPSLLSSGEASADFYLRTGYMPLRDPKQPPKRTQPLFTSREIADLVAFVGSHGGSSPPRVRPERGSLAVGLQVFTEHCAGCHQITG